MVKIHVLGALSAVALSLAACADNQDDAGARALLAKVREQGYRNWDRAPGYEARRSTSAPHANSVDIYVNDLVEEVLETATSATSWLEGSIIVKDGFSGSDLQLIAIMERRSDGWYWAEYDDDGDPDYSGRPEVCIDCHRRGSDLVRAFALP